MNMGFWGKIKKPVMVLAPMANVTDYAFRQIIAKYGKPDVFWTEFVSADGLCSRGKERLLIDLKFSKNERPIVAQIFSAHPEKIKQASSMIQEMGFDGLDINMGCPDRTVEKQGAGAALIKSPKLAREIIRNAKEGAPDLPVSVKTRIGYNKNELEKWLPELLAEEPAVVTIHARTRKEMSKVPARWEHVKEAVSIRDSLKSKTLIFGNGDAVDIKDAKKKIKETGADGVMLGRAIFGNPWLFNEQKPTYKERLKVLIEHTRLFERFLQEHKSFAIMKKHFKSYVGDFEGAKDLRLQLMSAENADDVENMINRYL